MGFEGIVVSIVAMELMVLWGVLFPRIAGSGEELLIHLASPPILIVIALIIFMYFATRTDKRRAMASGEEDMGIALLGLSAGAVGAMGCASLGRFRHLTRTTRTYRQN